MTLPTRVETPADEPLTRLRGARVEVDTRLVARVATALVLMALAASAIVLFVAGVNTNAQIAALRTHGVHVSVTVTTCVGNLGGSGSNEVSYTCDGTYVVAGHHERVQLPGTRLFGPGARVRGVAVPSDPGLFSTVAVLRSEHTSARLYIAPAVLTVLLICALVLVARRRRRTRATASA